MIKKVIISFLMAIIVFCGINLGTTTAFATEVDGTESASLTSNEKIAYISLPDLLPTGYTANDTIELMEGDNIIGTLTVDKNADYGFSGYVFKSGGLYSFEPNNDYIVKKFIYIAPSGGSVTFSLVNEQPSSTYMTIEAPTTAEKELIKASFADVKIDAYNAGGVVFDSSYYDDTQNPYVFKHSSTLKLGNIFLIYEDKHTHDYNYKSSYNDNEHWNECECGEKSNVEAHDFDDGLYTAPTIDEKGSTVYTCDICKGTKTEYINPSLNEEKVSISLSNSLVYDRNDLTQQVLVKYGDEELEESTHYTIEGNVNKNAGNYELIIKGAGIFVGEVSVRYSISKASVEKPTADSSVFTYNGQPQTYVLQTSEYYTISNATETNAGTYTITVELKDKTNYQWSDNTISDLTYSFVIGKATYDMSGVVFADKTVTYDGESYSIEATNLPTGVTVAYENNGKTDAGEYVITAIFTGNANYNAIANKTATLTINKVIVATPAEDTRVFTYNGQAQTYALQTNSLYTISNTTFTDADTHLIAVALVDKTNYMWDNGNSNDLTYSFVIGKATYDMSGVIFANKIVIYNGTAFSIEATNLPTGVTVAYENNGKTDAGEYVVTAIFTGNANYNAISDMTATLTINKATYDMSGVVFANKTVTYNGTAFSIKATNLPTGVTVAYENNSKTDAGEYVVTAIFTGSANYNAISDMTATLTINKATYNMSKVAFANKTVTYNGTAFSIEATNLPSGVTVAYKNNGKTDAGEYVVTAIFTGNANYNAIVNKTATLTIKKATYDMSAVVFVDKTVVYNGSTFSLEATNLPNGVTVSYENNGKINAGVYTITAKFTGDADNYELIADKTATLTIKKVSFTFDLDNENDAIEDIIITSDDGIDPNKELVVTIVESEKSNEDYKDFIDKNQKVAIAYDVKLIKEGASVQPDGTLKFKVIIPTELVGKDFRIIHIHNGNETSIMEYNIEGDYVVFESDKLSEFVFVYDMGSMLWLIIVLAIIALFEIAFLVYLSKKNNTFKHKKIASVYPPYIFGMFIAEWELVMVIALAVVVIALAIVSIIFATKVINSKAKTSTEEEEVAVAEESNNNQSIEDVKNDVDEKEDRIVKNFTDRLSQCSPETIAFYNAIKSELLSYKKVKSKISFKHESFRLGMPIVARLKIRGKSLYLFLALNPNDYKDSKYKIKDMSAVANCKDVPTMYKINLPRRAVYAKELIADLMKKFNTEKNG